MNPIRSCILCRKRKPKSELFRIVSKNSEAIFDNTQKINQRSIYICRDKKCIETCQNKISKNKFTSKISLNNNSLYDVLEYLKSEVEEK